MKALLQQALAALEMPCDRYNGTQAKIVNKAVEALRAAIAQPDEPVGMAIRSTDMHMSVIATDGRYVDKGGEPVYFAAPVQPYVPLTDEPVAWIYESGTIGGYDYIFEKERITDGHYADSAMWIETPLYPHPAPTYVPLTDAQIDHIVSARGWLPTMYDICRDIERAVRGDK